MLDFGHHREPGSASEQELVIIVTGGAGFIGSNLVKALSLRDGVELIVVDDLSDGAKFRNLVDCEVSEYWDKDKFLEHIRHDREFEVCAQAVFHQGACSDTTQWDGRYMMETNFEYSKQLFDYCARRAIPFLYASSASVYGMGPVFREERRFESPLNVYAYSKCLFDRYVERKLASIESQVVGLRYFNVYGPREGHKGTMASVALQLRRQLRADGKVRLFRGSDGYGDGEQRRDFVHVDDAVRTNLWFLDRCELSGIYNVGTGCSQTFNDVANAVIGWFGRGEIEYIPFPDHLDGHYQSFTEADINRLRQCGYEHAFSSVEEGVAKYMQALDDGLGLV